MTNLLKMCAMGLVLGLSVSCIEINNITPPADGGNSQTDPDAGDSNDVGGEDDAGDTVDSGDDEDAGSDEDTGSDDDTGSDEDTGSDDEDAGNDSGPVPACDENFLPEDACGGEIVGSWTLDSICNDANLVPTILPPTCAEAEVVHYEEIATGMLTVSATNFARLIEIDVEVLTHVPTSCPELVFGGCEEYEVVASSFSGLDASCVLNQGASRCECELTGSFMSESDGSYSYEDGTVVVGDRTFDVCRSGGGITLRPRPESQDTPVFVEVYGR
ncbi:hypothetical protein FRC98_13670 [Lujinxingia vulgaris]|uniref:Uncharacterized protein n=1 Tax=Lujinxingia vulgaris TaxID=2600176 RepID=A0A5C6XG53_9DELT|nr:hypothetical protein [Lujinxingia vulgaris]TXD36166.1 hypothetical protein FRC98_13670 [Lujinxingia vulgaris]